MLFLPKLIIGIASAVFVVILVFVLVIRWFLGGLFLESYPIKVEFSFDYGGKHIEATRYTVVQKRSNNFAKSFEVGRYYWEVARRNWSLALPDGATIILSPEWPSYSQTFAPDKSYKSVGRWFWIDNPGTPQKIIYGDSATRAWPGTDEFAALTSLKVDTAIERASNAHLDEARKFDDAHDDAKKLDFSNRDGPIKEFAGRLFTAVGINAIVGGNAASLAKIEQIRNATGWSTTPENCRVKSLSGPGSLSMHSLTKYTDGVRLIYSNGIWNGDVGPHFGGLSIMYSTGRQVNSKQKIFLDFGYGVPALDMIHAVEWQGESCSGIEIEVDTATAVIQFPSGKLALLSPSGDIAVWRN